MRASSYKLESDKLVLPAIEHLRGKIGEGEIESLKADLSQNAVFTKHKAEIGCCNFIEHEIDLEEGAILHREGARRMKHHKLEACGNRNAARIRHDRALKVTLGLWSCHGLKERRQLKDAYPKPRIDESL